MTSAMSWLPTAMSRPRIKFWMNPGRTPGISARVTPTDCRGLNHFLNPMAVVTGSPAQVAMSCCCCYCCCCYCCCCCWWWGCCNGRGSDSSLQIALLLWLLSHESTRFPVLRSIFAAVLLGNVPFAMGAHVSWAMTSCGAMRTQHVQRLAARTYWFCNTPAWQSNTCVLVTSEHMPICINALATMRASSPFARDDRGALLRGWSCVETQELLLLLLLLLPLCHFNAALGQKGCRSPRRAEGPTAAVVTPCDQ